MINSMDNIDKDFVAVSVPTSGRKRFLDILVVWLGFIIVVGTMAAGGGLASQANFSDILIGIFIGNIILGLFAVLSGYIGAQSGRSFYQLGELVFGEKSMRFAGLYVPVVLLGWFAIESAILGGFIGKLLGVPEVWERAFMFVAAIVMAVSTYFGFRALKRLSYILLPLIFGIGIFAIFQTDLTMLGGRQVISGEPQGLLFISGIVVSTWVMGVLLNLPDVARFAKSPLQGALAGFIGILIGNILNLLIGAIAAINTGQFDPSEILIGLGFIPLAIILAVANIWTTNDSNLYSATLGAARSFNISRRQAVTIVGFVGAMFAAFNPATVGGIFTLLITVGGTAPALGGVVLVSYIVRKIYNIESSRPVGAWISWIAGSGVGFYVGNLLGIISGFVTASVLIYLFYKFVNK